MNNIFVTGASGFIGGHLVRTLAEKGHTVHVLTRSTSNTTKLIHPNIRLFTGDILDKASIELAMKGCSKVYHLAGVAKMWMRDKSTYHTVNVTGTDHVLQTARSLDVEKVVFTSTAGVLPPSVGSLTNEESIKQPQLYTEYERTKNRGEDLALEYFAKGLPVVIIYPTKVFGPGPIDDSNITTMMIRNYMAGKWKIIPGNGAGITNYVYIDDAVEGITKAMEQALPGSRYIIGGENASYDQFFALIKQLSGINHRLYHIPYWTIRSIAGLEEARIALFNSSPLITTEWVKKLPYHWSKNIDRAKTELQYHPMSLQQGIEKTIQWLKAQQ